MVTDTIKAALWEELRFVKRQQWAVTTAVIALIAGAYSIAIALAVSAGAVCYSLLWRDEAHHLLLRMQGQVW